MTDDNNNTDKKPAVPTPRLRRSRILPALRPANLRRFKKLLLRLGTSEEVISMLPQITPYITRVLRLDRERVITYLQMSPDPDVRRWLSVYERADIEDSIRQILPYEVVCAAAKVPPLRLLECLGAIKIRADMQAAAMNATTSLNDVVDANITSAKIIGSEGTPDRALLYKATGFTPTPKGSTTTIQIQQAQVQQAAPTTVEPPIPEQTVRRLVNRFNEVAGESLPALPEATPVEYVPMPEDDDEEDEAIPVPVAINSMAPAAALAKKFHDREGGSSQE